MKAKIPMIVVSGNRENVRDVLAKLRKLLKSDGYAVRIEKADEPGKKERKTNAFLKFQVASQVAREDAAPKKLRTRSAKAVILIEQGIMSGASYVGPEELFALWRREGCSPIQLRDARYKGVIHVGAEDDPVLQAWIGTPHLTHIEGYDGDVARAYAWATNFLEGVENERKFKLLTEFSPSLLPQHACPVDICQTYIFVPEAPKRERLRKRGLDSEQVYFRSMKQKIRAGSCSEKEAVLTHDEFCSLLKHRSPGYADVVKTRWCFVSDGYYCELDVFAEGRVAPLLEIEFPRREPGILLPACLKGMLEEVTGQEQYMNGSISKQLALWEQEQESIAA